MKIPAKYFATLYHLHNKSYRAQPADKSSHGVESGAGVCLFIWFLNGLANNKAISRTGPKTEV